MPLDKLDQLLNQKLETRLQAQAQRQAEEAKYNEQRQALLAEQNKALLVYCEDKAKEAFEVFVQVNERIRQHPGGFQPLKVMKKFGEWPNVGEFTSQVQFRLGLEDYLPRLVLHFSPQKASVRLEFVGAAFEGSSLNCEIGLDDLAAGLVEELALEFLAKALK